MKKYFFGLFAVALAIGFSAFTKENVKKVDPNAEFTTYYFQYSGTDTEAAYETESNWTFLSSGLPSEDPCSGADNIVCVLNTPDLATGTTAALDTYLESLSSAATYCQTAARIDFKKP